MDAQAAPWWADRWADGEVVFGAWQMQGLIAGASLGLTLTPALERQAGTAGQAGTTPSLGTPRVSRALGRVLRGGCGASLSLPGHLGSVSPANGTRPVGLGGSSRRSRLHSCPTPIPSEALLLPGGNLAPCVEPKTSGCQRGRRGKPSSPPPPSPRL